MPRQNGAIGVQIEVDDTKATKDLKSFTKKSTKSLDKISKEAKETGKDLTKMSKSFDASKAIKGLAGLAVGIAGVSKAVETFSGIVDHARIFERLAVGAEFSIESLNQLNHVITQSGGDIDVLSDTIFDFTDHLGNARRETGAFRDLFNALGVDINQTNEDAFMDTLTSLENMTDETKRTSFGMELLSESWKSLSTTISRGDLQKQLKEGLDFQTLSKQSVIAFVEFDKTIKRVKASLQGVFAEFLSGGGLQVIEGTITHISTLFGTILGGDNAKGAGAGFASFVKDDAIPWLQTLSLAVNDMVFGIRKAFASIFSFFSTNDYGDVIGVQLIENAFSMMFMNIKTDALKTFEDLFRDIGESMGIMNPLKESFLNTANAIESKKDDILKTHEDELEYLKEENDEYLKQIKYNDDILILENKRVAKSNEIVQGFKDLNVEISKAQKKSLTNIFSPMEDQPQPFTLPIFNIQNDKLLENMLKPKKQEEEISIFEMMFGMTAGEQVSSIISQGLMIQDATQQVLNNIFQMKNDARQKEINATVTARQNEISGLIVSDRRRTQLLKQANKEEDALRKEAFEKKKKQDIANAFLNMASSIGGAWASAMQLPFPANVITGGVQSDLMKIIGISQIATIKAQQYADGGIVPGQSFTGDRVPAQVNSGEMILNQTQQAQLFKQANGGDSGGSGGVITVNIDNFSGSQDDIDRLEDMLTELQSNGRNPLSQ